MNETALQIAGILETALAQDWEWEIIAVDVNPSDDRIFEPHLHQGLEIKLPGRFTDRRLDDGGWKTANVVIIPAQVVHGSEANGDIVSILIEKNKITCVCNGVMVPEPIPIACLTELGVAPAATVNFLQSESVVQPDSPFLRQHVAVIIRTMLSVIGIALRQQSPTDGKSSLLTKTVNYIDRHYYRHDLSVEEVAQYVGVTQNYLVTMFRRELGLTIRQYLVKIRLEHARILLDSGRCLVKDAARFTGWNSAYYFSNCYREYYGHPPSDAQRRK